jgi:F-type H+-transporting ATPase subunit alpha
MIYAGTKGFLDDLAVSDLRRFEEEFFQYLDTSNRQLLDKIAEKKVLDEDLTAELEAAIKEAKVRFRG